MVTEGFLLSTSGNKTDLMERLQSALKSKLDDTCSADSVDDLDDDLLNDDDLDHEQLDTSESVLTELDEQLDATTTKITKRKLSESKSPTELDPKPAKKIVLNRNPSVTIDSNEEKQNGDHASSDKTIDSKDDDNAEKKVIKLSELSAKERLEMRAKKFGAPVSDDAKKLARAERFSLGSSTSTASTITTSASPTLDALKKRAERFGSSVSKVMSGLEQQERLEKRKERFGVVTSTNGTASQDEKAKQRLERFKTPIK